ncbi:MAG: aminomethyltransferase beta-barrel domain-containing protein, partial [Planctomycetota bacterium]
QEQLSRALFPLGGLTKEEVRRLAAGRGLPVSAKREGQDICFVPSGDYRNLFRRSALSLSPGKIVDSQGNVLGEHEGIELFTVGQRRWLGRAFGEPRYVIAVRPATREVVIGPLEELYARRLRAAAVNWVSKAPSPVSFRAQVQIRHRHRPAEAAVAVDESGRALVTFDEPQRAITPGQAAVFYEADEVAAGGWIDEALDGPQCT